MPYQITQTDIETARDVREHLLRDPHRPGYHFVVPEGLAHPADPNGAIFWRGNVHLGYIYQRHGEHCWGHVSSHDWLHWKHHLPWLTPTADSPETGIFSGNCFHGNGEAVFLYHGTEQGNSISTASDHWLDKLNQDAAPLLEKVVERLGGPPLLLLSDKLCGYKDGYNNTMRVEPRPVTMHIPDASINNRHVNNNQHEYHNGCIERREKGSREFNFHILGLFVLDEMYHNFLRCHIGLGGTTPAEKVSITMPGPDKMLIPIR